MNHDAGQHFLSLGRVLERADMTTRIVDVRSASLLPEETPELRPFENIQWMSVLKSLTAHQMYRRTMQVRVRRADALRFLLLDGAFPRAFYWCVEEADRNMQALPRGDGPRRQIARVKRMVQGADIADLAESNANLHGTIDELQIGLGDVHAEIQRTYFLHDVEAQSQFQSQDSPALS
jgi:uncharacterized alpha-E superfamily protein